MATAPIKHVNVVVLPAPCQDHQSWFGSAAEMSDQILTELMCVRQTAEGWQKFTAGWLVGGLSGVAWAWILTQTLPYYR